MSGRYEEHLKWAMAHKDTSKVAMDFCTYCEMYRRFPDGMTLVLIEDTAKDVAIEMKRVS